MTPEDQNQPQAPATGLDAFAGKAAEMLNMAVEHHKAGRLDVAETIYKQLAEMAPNNPDLAHLYGMLHAQKGLVVEGLEMIRKAIAMQPDTAVYYANLANVLMQSGRVGEAAAMLRQAAALRPEVSEYKTSLADALRQMGRTDEAEQAYRAVLKADPESETALINLGTLLLGLGRWKEAEKIYRRILEENPDSILVKGNFAGLLLMKGDVEEAIRLYREVLNSNPDSLDIRRNLTSALYRAMAYDEALAECEEVLRRNPGDVSALMMKGDLARERERFNEAEQAYRQVVADHPDHPMAHAALGLVRLAQGDYGQGWREYEWHWKADPFMGNLLKALPRPLWDGRDLEGRTLLVVCQHGLSDTMQFLRYIPRIAADKGGQVVVACHEDLVRLVRTLDGANQVVPFEKVPV